MSCELENIIAPRELCDEAQMAQDAWKFYESRGLRPLYSRVTLRTISSDDIPEALREHVKDALAFVMGQIVSFIEPDWSEFKRNSQLSRIAGVVAHEVAHIFTPETYKESWVIESFADAAGDVYTLHRYGKCYSWYHTKWLYDGLYKKAPYVSEGGYRYNYRFSGGFFNYLVEHDDWSADFYEMYLSSLRSLIEGVNVCLDVGMRKISVLDVPGFMFDYYVEKDSPIVVGYLRPFVAYFVASRHGAVEVSRSDRCTARSVYIGGGVTAAVVACSDGVTNVEIRSTGRAPQRRITPVSRTISAEEVGVTCDYTVKRMGKGSVVKAHGYTIYYPVPPDMLFYIAKAADMPAAVTAEGVCLWDVDFARLSVAVAMLYADKKRSLRVLQYAIREMNIGDIVKLLGQLYMAEVDRCIRQRKPHSTCDSVARHVGEMAHSILRYMRKVAPEIDQFLTSLEW